jgi:glucose-1-phosphate thymidylyltransferase
VQVQKAVVLAGKTVHDEPWPSVPREPKHLVPVANRPILFHALESLRDAGVREALIAVEPESAEATMAAVADGAAWDLDVDYLSWRPVSGVRGAVAAAQDFVGDHPLLVQPADALLGEHIQPHLVAFSREELDLLTLRVARRTGSTRAPLDGGHLLGRRAISLLVDGDGDPDDFAAGLRARGSRVRVQTIDGCLPCHGGEDALLEGNRRMLERLGRSVDPSAFPTCEFQGAVQVHPNAVLEDCLIRGPVVIGPDCWLSNAYVGPYTSIGAGVRIDGAQIEYSILLDGAQLAYVGPRLESSVIGRGARIGRSFGLPAAMRVSVGDGAQITLA